MVIWDISCYFVIFDVEGKELELENKIFDEILFYSEQAIEFVIHAIRNKLSSGFQYKVF